MMPDELDGSLAVGDLALEVVLGAESVIDRKYRESALNEGNVSLSGFSIEVAEDAVVEEPKIQLFQRHVVIFAIRGKAGTHYKDDPCSVCRFWLVHIHEQCAPVIHAVDDVFDRWISGEDRIEKSDDQQNQRSFKID